MRRMVVLLALFACGKTGDPTLEPAIRSDVLDITESGFDMHLERHGKRFTWDYTTIRRDKADVARKDSGTVAADVVDRFLRTVAAQRTGESFFAPSQPQPAERHVHVSIRPRDPALDSIVLESTNGRRWHTRDKWLAAEPSPVDDAYEEMVTSIGRPPNAP